MTTPLAIAESVAGLRGTPSYRSDMWQLRPATVVTGESTSLMIQFDGEGFEGSSVVNVPATLMTGTAAPGDRVMVQSVLPNLNYVVNNLSRGPGPSQESTYIAPDAQVFGDTAFHDVLVSAVPATIRFVKYYTSSRIHVNHNMAAYVSANGIGVEGAIQIDGTDYTTTHMIYNTALQHLNVGAAFHLPADFAAGVYECTLRFRKFLGAGNVNIDTFDVITCTITETP